MMIKSTDDTQHGTVLKGSPHTMRKILMGVVARELCSEKGGTMSKPIITDSKITLDDIFTIYERIAKLLREFGWQDQELEDNILEALRIAANERIRANRPRIQLIDQSELFLTRLTRSLNEKE